MKKILFKKIIPIIIIVILTGATFSLGFYFGYSQNRDNQSVNNISNKNGILETTQNINLNNFWKVWNLLDEKFVSPDEVTNQEKVWGAIKGLTASYKDPYTVFMPPTEAKIFNSDIKGSFTGVGMEIGKRDGVLTVVAPLKGTPAEKAGIKPGDKIIKIDGKSTANFNTDQAVKLIRGKKGTTVKITISREGVGKLLNINIRRDNINIPTIKTELKGNVFIISLYSFSATSPNLFRNALRKFIKSKTNKLIIDLRGNPGGYLDAAVDMASWFLPAGKVVVTEDYGPNKGKNIHRSKGYNIFNKNLKLVILVNGGSASASEILAGALQEYGIATLVGTQTFGKGSVQELINITKDTSLKVTVAKWLTPKGISISKNGLTPNIKVGITEAQFKKGIDPQLNKAIEILSK